MSRLLARNVKGHPPGHALVLERRLSIALKAISAFRRRMPAPAPEVGHEVKLINFGGGWGQWPALNLQRFAYNKTFEEAFPDGIRGFNRPTNVRFGPDGCAYIADYDAVRDFGRSDPDAGFKNGADAALVQIPGTGVIWKICPK
jgi:hypothetical protein